jgi:hypothetical protein
MLIYHRLICSIFLTLQHDHFLRALGMGQLPPDSGLLLSPPSPGVAVRRPAGRPLRPLVAGVPGSCPARNNKSCKYLKISIV